MTSAQGFVGNKVTFCNLWILPLPTHALHKFWAALCFCMCLFARPSSYIACLRAEQMKFPSVCVSVSSCLVASDCLLPATEIYSPLIGSDSHAMQWRNLQLCSRHRQQEEKRGPIILEKFAVSPLKVENARRRKARLLHHEPNPTSNFSHGRDVS